MSQPPPRVAVHRAVTSLIAPLGGSDDGEQQCDGREGYRDGEGQGQHGDHALRMALVWFTAHTLSRLATKSSGVRLSLSRP